MFCCETLGLPTALMEAVDILDLVSSGLWSQRPVVLLRETRTPEDSLRALQSSQ